MRALSFAVSSAVLTLLLACVPACGNDDTGSSTSSSSGGNATACERDTRKDVYAAGLSKTGAAMTVKLLDAQPAPLVKGTNTLVLQVLDGAGKPVDAATITIVPFMPDHGHGSAVAPIVTPAGADGKYNVSKVYLSMAGLWELRMNVQVPGSTPADVTFSFCLDG